MTTTLVHTDFKKDYAATREDAVRLLRRVRAVVHPLGYQESLFGSTVTKGKGHDVDMTVVGLGYEVEAAEPWQVAMALVEHLAKRIFLYEQHDVGDVSDVYVIMLVVDRGKEVMLDLHVKGDAGL